MDNSKAERRAAMMAKVKKLLAMARDAGGNKNEQETAMRQANRIMAQFGIDEAEVDMAAIDAGEMVFGEAQCGPDGKAPAAGKVYRSMPRYAGLLAVGVAKFTDCIVIRKTTEQGEMLAFRGEKEDVLFARWIFAVLVNGILSEQKASGWTARGDANSFRGAAASTLQRRLFTLADERRKLFQEAQATSNSRALVVVDYKRNEIVARFGAQKTRNTRASYASHGAYMAGQSAGARMNIPSGRPLSGSSNGGLLN